MKDRFDHRCTEKECPHIGQRSTYGSCNCHQTREEMMMAHIQNLERLEAVEPSRNTGRTLPRLSMEMLASLEETWEAMEAVGEDPKDAAALRALLDWHYNFSAPPKEHAPSAWPHMNVKGEWEDREDPTP